MGTVLAEVQWDAFLKELYPDGLPLDIMQRKHLLLSKMRKEGDAYGEYLVIPVIVDGPSGRSAGIGTLLSVEAQSPIGPTTSRKFNVTLAKDYAATWIDELTIRKAANDRGSFVNARRFEIDAILRQLGASMAHALYRAGDGTVGRGDGAYSVAGNVITLLNRADTKFFGLGMVLDFIINNAGVPGALRAVATNRVKVTKIDEDAGTVTCALDVTGVAVVAFSTNYTAPANTDWFAPVGDYNALWATTGALKLRGLAAWIPLTAPSGGDNFYGVDRSEFPTRLAGNRLNDPTSPAYDSIMALAEVMHERGANPDFVVVTPRQFTKISKQLSAKIEYDGGGDSATHGFMRFFVATSAGMLPIYADPDCPEGLGYILTLETWAIKHLGIGEVGAADGLTALRRAAADQIEIRAKYYAQVVCYAPGHNGVFSVS